jgi:hypothetical protein
MKNKIIIIQTIILLILLGITVSLKRDVKTINENQQYDNSKLQNIDSEISSISNLVYEKNQKEKLIQSQDFQVENIDGKYQKAKVRAIIRFNEIKNNSTVYLEYRTIYRDDSKIYQFEFKENIDWNNQEEQFGEWKQVQLNRRTGTEYSCNFEADYKFDYETRILIESDDITKSEETEYINIHSDSTPAYNLEIHPLEISSEGYMTFEILLMQDLYEDSRIKIKSAACKVYNNQTKLDEFNLFEEQNLLEKDANEYMWSESKKVENCVSENGEIDQGLRIEVTITDEFGKEYQIIWKPY